LLCAERQRIDRCCSAEKRDELAPPHELPSDEANKQPHIRRCRRCASPRKIPVYVGQGQKRQSRKVGAPADDFRYASVTGLNSCCRDFPDRATTRREQVQQTSSETSVYGRRAPGLSHRDNQAGFGQRPEFQIDDVA
jgi:hypothetical protein